MTTDKANSVILVSGIVTLGSVVIGRAAPQRVGGLGAWPPLKIFIGTSVSLTALSIIAEFAPQVAAGFAVAMAGTAFIGFGARPLTCYFVPDSAGCPQKQAKTSTVNNSRIRSA